MAKPTAVFWDIGGVILTNGWDHNSRNEAVKVFHLDADEFRERHDLTFPAFDAGNITLNEYLDRTIFYEERSFTRDEFTAFMFAQSREFPESRAVLDEVAATGKYLVAAINNEPTELNQYRIEAFHLRKSFQLFFSSCFVHARKPDELIFRIALNVTQRSAEECVFVDDRPLNLDVPRRLGMNVVRFQDAAQLRRDLRSNGVEV